MLFPGIATPQRRRRRQLAAHRPAAERRLAPVGVLELLKVVIGNKKLFVDRGALVVAAAFTRG
jgi:hypothetical protein